MEQNRKIDGTLEKKDKTIRGQYRRCNIQKIGQRSWQERKSQRNNFKNKNVLGLMKLAFRSERLFTWPGQWILIKVQHETSEHSR